MKILYPKMKAADAAVAQAGKTNRKFAIAIVEPSGELVYFRKMDGAPYSATRLAQDKAVTSARFRRPSRAFQEQIAKGGPVTVTHPDVRRYFMSIPEAAQLILQAGAMGEGGEIFILDMGDYLMVCHYI
jgi:uncharacterized protein GlcG (DUF336 family)